MAPAAHPPEDPAGHDEAVSPTPPTGPAIMVCAVASALGASEPRQIRLAWLARSLSEAGYRPEVAILGGPHYSPEVSPFVESLRAGGLAVHAGLAGAFPFEVVICCGHEAGEVVVPAVREPGHEVTVVLDVGSLASIAKGRDLASVPDLARRGRPFDSAFGALLLRELNACVAADAVLTETGDAADLICSLLGGARPVLQLATAGSSKTDAGQLTSFLDAATRARLGERSAMARAASPAVGVQRRTDQGPGRIFCIGLTKTGTTSLHRALQLLGFRSLHCGPPNERDGGTRMYLEVLRAKNEGARLLDFIGDDYDAYSDIETLSKSFELADLQYPGSRFILTVREVDEWIDSRRRHVERNQRQKAEGTYHGYGSSLRIEVDRWRVEWDEHVGRVLTYFATRPDDLLVMNVTSGDGYELLAPFVGRPVPETPFPRDNVDTERLGR